MMLALESGVHILMSSQFGETSILDWRVVCAHSLASTQHGGHASTRMV